MHKVKQQTKKKQMGNSKKSNASKVRLDKLLSVLASRGPVFRRYLLNGAIDQNETWTQGVSASDPIIRNILS